MQEYYWIRPGGVPLFLVRDGPIWDAYHVELWGSGYGFWHSFDDRTRDSLAAAHPGVSPVRTQLGPGDYHSRIWRSYGQVEVTSKVLGLDQAEREAQRVSRMLTSKLQEIFRYVDPDANHGDVFSHELRSLLTLACIEVESACKAVLRANHAKPAKGRKFNIGDYARLCVPMKLEGWHLRLSTRPAYGLVQPFAGWSPGVPLPWYQAYNACKHDREANLPEATLAHTINAVAGAVVLNLAQFGYDNRDAAYFSPDEFSTEKEPSWTEEELYVPATMGVKLPGPPQIPLRGTWQHVDCPL